MHMVANGEISGPFHQTCMKGIEWPPGPRYWLALVRAGANQDCNLWTDAFCWLSGNP